MSAIENHSDVSSVDLCAITPAVETTSKINPFECSPEEFKRRLELRKLNFKKGDFIRAINQHCRACGGPVKDCDGTNCTLFPVRNKDARRGLSKKTTRFAIRDECRNCVGSHTDICQSPGCNLYPMRFGARRPI